MIEQRQYARVKVLLPVQISAEDSETPVQQAACLDLSVGGLMCQTEKKMRVGSIVSLRVQLTETDQWDVDGKVVRVEWVREVRSYRIAFEFTGPSPQLVERLTYFLLYPKDVKSPPVIGRIRSPFEL